MEKFFKQYYGPWALITGASSGIGEQFSHLVASQDINLLLTARRHELLENLKEQLEAKYGINVKIISADLSLESDVDKVIEGVMQEDIGLVISNAGFGLKGGFDEEPLELILSMLKVNAITPLVLAHKLLPILKQRQRAGSIFTGSMEGEAAFPWSSAYAASKAFIHSLGNGLWEEYRKENVDVLVLAPGSTDTNAPIAQGINRDQLVGIMSPNEVASQALHQLGKKPFLLTGWHNRLFIYILRWLPRSWAIRLSGFGMAQAIARSKK